MRSVLHRAARSLLRGPDRSAEAEQVEPSQAQALTQDQQLLFNAIKREFPFMSDDCIMQVMSEL